MAQEHHEHHYEDGVLVRTVIVREPEWTEQDRAEALALAYYRAGLCPGGCGQPLRESLSHYETGPQYDAKRIRCRACHSKAEAMQELANANTDHRQTFLWVVEKTEG